MFIVTGGAGFIGSAMVRELNISGIRDILIVDHLERGSRKWKNLLPLEFDGFMGKYEFRQKLRAGYFTGKKIDGVIHFGACSSTLEPSKSYLLDNNFRCSAEIAEFCHHRKIRMIYASSCATYGFGENGFSDDEAQLEKLCPRNMYAYSKHLFDLWAKKNGMFASIAGCKFSNIFGPNEWHKGEMRSMAMRGWEQISATGKISLFRSTDPRYADGEQQRDFLYVKDAVKMALFLFDSGAGGIFNIGSGTPASWNKFAGEIFAAMAKPVNIEYVDMPANLCGKYQNYTCADPAKILTLGYSGNITPLAAAIGDYVGNHLIPQRYLGDE